ncbi:hypothetical protein GCM10008022_41090 [Paenibacillus hunanensis]|nr:hypothetical protein GCM10008022_41090 [Paenibacillus hunanensis]
MPLKFAIVVVEDANEDICILKLLPSSMIIAKEPFLLDEAKKRLVLKLSVLAWLMSLT